MGDIVLEHRQDTQSSEEMQASEDASLKCVFIGCENKEVFPTKPALKYFFPSYVINIMLITS
jgi:hypothetical protein